MLNVRLPFVGEPAARIGTIDAAKLSYDPVLHGLRIPIVVRVVRGAARFLGQPPSPATMSGSLRGRPKGPWRARRPIQEWKNVRILMPPLFRLAAASG